jgi:hypothetical protein
MISSGLRGSTSGNVEQVPGDPVQPFGDPAMPAATPPFELQPLPERRRDRLGERLAGKPRDLARETSASAFLMLKAMPDPLSRFPPHV